MKRLNFWFTFNEVSTPESSCSLEYPVSLEYEVLYRDDPKIRPAIPVRSFFNDEEDE